MPRMPKMPGNAYWETRAAQRMDGYLRNSEQTMRIIGNAYQAALHNIREDIDRIYWNYARGHNLTNDEAHALLDQPVSQEEYNRILGQLNRVRDRDLRHELIVRANAPGYQYRMSRLQAMQESIHQQMLRVADVELAAAAEGFTRGIYDAYGRTLFDIQKGTGYGWAVNQIAPGTVQEILRNPWSGEHYSTRIWQNSHDLSEWLQTDLTAGMLTGESADRLAEMLEDHLGVGYRAAERLVTTEMVYMANAAEIQSYIEAGIDKYIFIATLDNRTSEQCAELDGTTHKVSDAVAGKNLPPIHPWCRSTTIAKFDDMDLARFKRAATDPVTGEETLIPANMTYGDWAKQYVKPALSPGVDEVPALRKALQNVMISTEPKAIGWLHDLGNGKSVKTRIAQIDPMILRKKDWVFDWRKESAPGVSVYALYAEGDGRIQGLMSRTEPDKFGGMEVRYIESAAHNRATAPDGQAYDGIGGHLFAEAIRQAREAHVDGYIHFIAKSGLMDYYRQNFHAMATSPRERRMAILDDAATALLQRYFGR